jgi:uncharacterized protein YfaS (alpha-2-macroglobulin family)
MELFRQPYTCLHNALSRSFAVAMEENAAKNPDKVFEVQHALEDKLKRLQAAKDELRELYGRPRTAA